MSEYKHNPCSVAIIAWTGGSTPMALDHVHPLEYKLVLALLDAQMASFRAFWGKEPDRSTCELYLIRARFDAHATFRAGCCSMPAPDEENTEEKDTGHGPMDGLPD